MEIMLSLLCSGLALSLSCGFLVKEKSKGYFSCANVLYLGTSMGFWVFGGKECYPPISTTSDYFTFLFFF